MTQARSTVDNPIEKTMNTDDESRLLYSSLGKFEWALFVSAVLCAFAVVAVFIREFGHNAPGQPEDWAHFGDYIGGVLNPIIGIITVLLIVLTLATTRKEAADARKEMKSQLAHFKT